MLRNTSKTRIIHEIGGFVFIVNNANTTYTVVDSADLVVTGFSKEGTAANGLKALMHFMHAEGLSLETVPSCTAAYVVKTLNMTYHIDNSTEEDRAVCIMDESGIKLTFALPEDTITCDLGEEMIVVSSLSNKELFDLLVDILDEALTNPCINNEVDVNNPINQSNVEIINNPRYTG
jgi:hypothetical protein